MAETTRKIRLGRIWSANSKFFHSKTCPAAKRISKENLKSGTAPADKVPHSCISNTDIDSEKNSGSDASANAGVNSASKGTVSQTNTQSTNQVRCRSFSQAHISNKQASAPDHDDHHSTQEKQDMQLHLNPYCQCNPCECTPPCTCGLRKRESTTRTAWDADNHLLTHTVSDIYRPEARNHAAVNEHNQHTSSNSQPPVNHVNTRVATPDEALNKLSSAVEKQQHFLQKYQQTDEFAGHHDANAVSVRTLSHKGYEIEIQTSFEITIDGKKLDVHIQVSPDGKVHCHSIPTYESGSAVDLIRAIVDNFRDDFPPKS